MEKVITPKDKPKEISIGELKEGDIYIKNLIINMGFLLFKEVGELMILY